MIEKIIDRRMMKVAKNVYNHWFVIDVKLATCRNGNCLSDPNTITQLIDKEELINKM